MKRFVQFATFGAIALLIGFMCGWSAAGAFDSSQMDRIIAVKWGDGKYGPAFYGAQVNFTEKNGVYVVSARVRIGRGNDYFHDCGELGSAKSEEEAVAKWGAIDWRDDGLHIGSGPEAYFLPRVALENHR